MKYRLLKIIILVFVAISLPTLFSGKAFHIDDTVFIHTSRQILINPLDPYTFSMNWEKVTEKVFDFNSNPPGISYYLAAVIRVFGESERSSHLSFILFTLIASISMFYLARRFVSYPFAAALLFLFSPICVVMCSTVMLDYPLAAFFILSITLFIYGHDSQKTVLLALSGIAACVTLMIKYNGISIIPLMVLYYILNFKSGKKWNISVIILPMAAFWGWSHFTEMVYGESHFMKMIGFQSYGIVGIGDSVMHLLPHLSYLGGAAVFPILLLIPLVRQDTSKKIIILIAGAVSGCVLLFLLANGCEYNAVNGSIAFVFLSCILFYLMSIFYDICSAHFQRSDFCKDKLFLFLWVSGILVMQNSGVHSSAKYMILAVPPLLLLILSEYFWSTLNRKTRIIFIIAAVVATMSVGSIVGIADYQFADIYRKMADYAGSRIVNKHKDKIYFTGHWGFQYYMERKGFIPYESESEIPARGDILVTCSLAWPQKLGRGLSKRITLIDQKEFTPSLPIRIMHNINGEQANFYSYWNYLYLYGILPYSISRNGVENLRIYKVN